MKAKDLPVYQQKDKILKALEKNQVIVVQSPTGSGKTTQIPIILNDAGYSQFGTIGITQPRRIATLSVSEYIAKQLKSEIPGYVGYKMRFDDQTSFETRLKIMTDGILLQELKHDRLLMSYSVIMIDEAHERSLNIDFILGLLKNILKQRPEFKVIISSATINANVFAYYFDNCPIINIETKIYPINVFYKPRPHIQEEDFLYKDITGVVEDKVNNKRDGDILVFLPGERDIKMTIDYLEQSKIAKKLFILPLYGRLSKEEQEKVFIKTPRNKTKVIVSTNIAETSVTIDNITTVIDSGLAKYNYYNPKTFTSALIESEISKASADQRKGRAGRTAPGNCYRLYSRDDFRFKDEFTKEEIFRTDLSEVVLRMADLGIKDFEGFDFISAPSRGAILSAVETLSMLGAINRDRSLTEIGEKMVLFPLSPRHSKILIEAIYKYPDVLSDVLIAVSFLTSHTPFVLPQGEELEARAAHHNYRDPQGDFLSYLKIFNEFKNALENYRGEKYCKQNYLDFRTMLNIVDINEQLSEIVSEMGVPIGEKHKVREYLLSICAGLIQFVCVRTKTNIYRSHTADKISIHPGSVLYKENPEFIVAGEIVRTSKTFARAVSKLEKSWIKEISPELLPFLSQSKKSAKHSKKGSQKGYKNVNSKENINIDKDSIKIGKTIFKSVKINKKRSLVVFDWDRFKKIRFDINAEEFIKYRDLRGYVKWKNYTILNKQKLKTIFFAAPYFNPEKDFIDKHTKRNYSLKSKDKKIIYEIENILKLAKIKENGKNLGFLVLNSDGSGSYWFTAMPNFLVAINENIYALEILIDDAKDKCNKKEREIINKTYRKLLTISETL